MPQEQSQTQNPQETLQKAKRKALRLLEHMDRTEAGLQEKLLDAGFDEDTAAQAVEYAKSFGYIDDERYVRNYIEYRREQKSRRQLEQELQYKKGVSPALIRKVYEEMEPADEKAIIRRHLLKKHYDPSGQDEGQKRRMIASLVRKGFHMGDILAVLGEVELRNS